MSGTFQFQLLAKNPPWSKQFRRKCLVLLSIGPERVQSTSPWDFSLLTIAKLASRTPHVKLFCLVQLFCGLHWSLINVLGNLQVFLSFCEHFGLHKSELGGPFSLANLPATKRKSRKEKGWAECWQELSLLSVLVLILATGSPSCATVQEWWFGHLDYVVSAVSIMVSILSHPEFDVFWT